MLSRVTARRTSPWYARLPDGAGDSRRGLAFLA